MVMPLKKIDADQVLKLAAMFCTDEEIACFFGCGETTLKRRFRKELDTGRSHAKMSIKRKQYDLAVNHSNVAMLIWLGKQYLGQRDKVDQTIRDETPGRKPIEKLTDDELKAELAKQAAATGAAGRVESPPGAEEPA